MIFAGLLLTVLIFAALFIAITALVQSRRVEELVRRVDRLEDTLRHVTVEQGQAGTTAESSPRSATRPTVATAPLESAGQRARPPAHAPSAHALLAQRKPIHWEMLIGRQALGWVAVVLVIFAAAFFIRYAIDNYWIGPLGQVALAELGGLALVLSGWYYHRRQWRMFSQMLTSAGVVVVYLATYAAFGFYALLSRDVASFFLTLIIIESSLLALRYDSPTVGLTAVLGGLLTPLLMVSAHDDYQAFFTYLAIFNLGVVLLRLARSWPAIGAVALVGTQGLFWMWFAGNYHPEKFVWALGFQGVVYGLFLGHQMAVHFVPGRRILWEDLARLVLEASFWFAAFYILLRDDPLMRERVDPWMGTVAMGMAVLYALLARLMLSVPRRNAAQVFTALAISAGFVALAFPIQAEAAWVALGWAAEGAVLWWFGQRIANLPLRVIGGAMAVAAVARLLGDDLPPKIRQPFVPIFNSFALPAIGVAACLLAAVVSTRHRIRQRSTSEQALARAAGGAAILLLWLVLSLECYDFFEARAHQRDALRDRWLWLGQMALSVLWAVFSTVVLVAGFRCRLASLRWLALALYGVTVLKVFYVDMVGLDEMYRIVAFFVLAVFMGLAAWGYQRIAPDDAPATEAQPSESQAPETRASEGAIDE